MLNSVSGKATVNGTANQTVKNEYSYYYNNDALMNISHNGFKYKFEYNELNKTKAIRILDVNNNLITTLAEYEYNEQNAN